MRQDTQSHKTHNFHWTLVWMVSSTDWGQHVGTLGGHNSISWLFNVDSLTCCKRVRQKNELPLSQFATEVNAVQSCVRTEWTTKASQHDLLNLLRAPTPVKGSSIPPCKKVWQAASSCHDTSQKKRKQSSKETGKRPWELIGFPPKFGQPQISQKVS